MRWDVLVVFVVLYIIASVPVDIAFDLRLESIMGFAMLNSAVDILFFVDIMLAFRTGVCALSSHVYCNCCAYPPTDLTIGEHLPTYLPTYLPI